MIFIIELRDEPGSLSRFLRCPVGVNVVRVESRPVRGHPGVYHFLLDVESESPDVARTIEQYTMQCRRLSAWPDTSSGWAVPIDFQECEMEGEEFDLKAVDGSTS